MLVNPKNKAKADKAFQAYLDKEEASLHVRLAPILTAAIRLQVTRSSVQARDYVEKRGTTVLLASVKRIYSDMYRDVDAATRPAPTKAVDDDGFTLSGFMEEQLAYLTRYAAIAITGISESLTTAIADKILSLVKAGRSNDEIARQIREEATEISRSRSATIARTETHNAALAATEASLKYKRIRVKKKQWWSAQDSRVRLSHRAVHAVILDVDQPFDVGDHQMMRPGDDSLGAGPEEIINCRCSILYLTETSIVPEDEDEPASDEL